MFGPSFGNQTTDEIGLRVFGCTDVEISNMEVAGWGGAAIEIDNEAFTDIPDHEPDPILALVHDNYLHDNKQPTHGGTLGIGGHAGGYGVNTGQGGWARIFNNTLDNNRHDVTASAKAGGYEAEHNLILKGGGYHGAWYEKYIHVFDVHGTDHCDTPSSSAFNCGDAGRSFLFKENVFQYKKTTDIKICGKPRGLATITGNVFARSDQDAAIDLQTPDNVMIVGNNQFNIDQFGAYDVCDFDGDGFDDLFLATGVSWWFSGQGRFPWTFLRADQSKRENLRFGYFDNDNRCDVLMELPSDSGQWFISSGGMTDPFATPLGNFGHPLNEVGFGRFDPTVRDHRIGVTLPTTHAFWRRADGQWFVTPLTHPEWKPVQSSSFPLSQLRFGSFTGDGETDVLAVENGHWSISKAGAAPWVTLNPTLSDPVENLYIANMDADDKNILSAFALHHPLPAPAQKVDTPDERGQGAGTEASAAADAHDAVETDCLRSALQFVRAAIFGDEQAGCLTLNAGGDQYRSRLGECLHARGNIGRVPEHLARRVDHDRPRIEADARGASAGAFACVARVELGERALDGESCPHRALGVVLLRPRIAEQGHEPVAEFFQHMPTEFAHRARGCGEIAVDQIAPILRVEPGRNGGRAHKIAEHHRNRAALGEEFRGCLWWSR